jgi:Uncharacterised nucleotidyltransferase
MPPSLSPRAAVAAANLRIDAVTVEVVDALRDARIDSIVLKGPSLAHWLGDDVARPYVDTDLLVQQERLDDARTVLERLGFEPYLEGADLGDRWAHPAWLWMRGDRLVDLHHGLAGAEADPVRIWSLLRRRTVPLTRGRSELKILDRPATALVLALHAAQHGAAVEQPLRDLRLGLERFERPVWDEAARLAGDLGASGAFASGLRLVPDAAPADLAAAHTPSVPVALAAASAPPQALALEQLASQRGAAAKLGYVRRRLVPPAPWMRASYPLARHGRIGLASAHAWRLLSAPVRLGRALPAWLRARREAAG